MKKCKLILLAAVLLACNREVNPSAPEYQTVTEHDGLAFFQEIFGTGSIGVPLPVLDPDETHLFVGVDNMEEALVFWDHSLSPDIERIPSETNNFTYTLTASDGTVQGTVSFAPGTQAGHVAEITTNLPALKDFKTVTFLDNLYWPANSVLGKYRLGDVRKEHIKIERSYPAPGTYETDQVFVCVREKSNGVKPLFVALTPEEYEPTDKNGSFLLNSDYCPARANAVMISNTLRKDWTFFNACFEEAGGGALVEDRLYWYDETIWHILYTAQCCIKLNSGDIDNWDISHHSPRKHVLLKIDWEDQ